MGIKFESFNFKAWMEDVAEKDSTAEDVIQYFLENNLDINAASIIDGSLTKTHMPFIYLEKTNKLYIDDTGYHRGLIENIPDADLKSELRMAYLGAVPSAVGRIGYRCRVAAIKPLSGGNFQKLMYGDVNFSDLSRKQRQDLVDRDSIESVPYSLRKAFDEVDLIAFYRPSPELIPVAARAAELLVDDVRDPDKTVVIVGNNRYRYLDFVKLAKKPTEPEVKPMIMPTEPREKKPFYTPDYKPKDWKSAFKWAGVYPTIGDSTIHKGNKYHG